MVGVKAGGETCTTAGDALEGDGSAGGRAVEQRWGVHGRGGGAADGLRLEVDDEAAAARQLAAAQFGRVRRKAAVPRQPPQAAAPLQASLLRTIMCLKQRAHWILAAHELIRTSGSAAMKFASYESQLWAKVLLHGLHHGRWKGGPTRETWLSRRCKHWSMRLLSYCPARKGTAYSLSLHSVRMCSAVLL
jgi:hypothetical protein